MECLFLDFKVIEISETQKKLEIPCTTYCVLVDFENQYFELPFLWS